MNTYTKQIEILEVKVNKVTGQKTAIIVGHDTVEVSDIKEEK